MRLLITGASRGLGQVAAEYFSSEHEVYVMSRSGMPPECPYRIVKPEELGRDWQFDGVLHTGGGGMGLRHPILQAGELYKLFRLNIGEACEINSKILPYMKEKGRGNIVHTCSIASGEAIGSVGYNTCKAALAAYVRSLGREMASFGVIITGIAPGAFTAPGNAMERLLESNPASYKDFTDKRLPRKVMGKAEELLPIIRLLLSPEASMMGGTVVTVDAGEGTYYSA